MHKLALRTALFLRINNRWAKHQRNDGFNTVQQALHLAQNGDTILVYPGIYKEGNLVIRKSVYLKGIGMSGA